MKTAQFAVNGLFYLEESVLFSKAANLSFNFVKILSFFPSSKAVYSNTFFYASEIKSIFEYIALNFFRKSKVIGRLSMKT
jgi:hypothetical protein